MLTQCVRYGSVVAVVVLGTLALSAGPSPARGEGARPPQQASRASEGPTPAVSENGLVQLTGPEDAEGSAALAVQQLGQLGSRATISRSGRFIIVSDAEAQWTLGRGALLERAAHQFRRFADRLGYTLTPGSEPLVCVLINDHDRYATFAAQHDGVEAGWVAGYYASLSNRIVFYNDETSPALDKARQQLADFESLADEARDLAKGARSDKRIEVAATLESRASEIDAKARLERDRLSRTTKVNAQAKAVHEAVHLLSYNWGLQQRDRQYPFWLTEGLAASFETESANQAFGPDHSFSARQKDFDRLRSQGRLLPLEVLVQMIGVPGEDEETAEVMYAQSWSLFRYLYRYERADLAEYFRDFLRQPAGRLGPERQFELFEARFGDVTALERRWLKRTAPENR